MKNNITVSLIAICLVAALGHAQPAPRANQPAVTGRQDSLDPSPINPAVDPNIDMFLNNWKTSKPRSMYGHLVFHDILTRLEGPDAQHPTRKGAVLVNITAVSYATLEPGAVAAGKIKTGERQVFYASAGTGQLTVNSKSFDVRKGTGFTLASDLDFRLTSTGKEPLAFYVRTEPLPENY